MKIIPFGYPENFMAFIQKLAFLLLIMMTVAYIFFVWFI